MEEKWKEGESMARPVKVGPQGGKASTRAKNAFNSENYDRLYPYVKKGHKAVFTRAAKEKEYDSLNDFLEDVMFTRSVEILGKETVEKIIEEEVAKAAAEAKAARVQEE